MVYTASNRMQYETMVDLEKALASNPDPGTVNLNFLFLYAGHQASLRNERDRALHYYSQLSTDHLKALFFNSFNLGLQSRLLAPL